MCAQRTKHTTLRLEDSQGILRKLELKFWETTRVCWGHLLEWDAMHVLSTKVKDVDKEMFVQPVKWRK